MKPVCVSLFQICHGFCHSRQKYTIHSWDEQVKATLFWHVLRIYGLALVLTHVDVASNTVAAPEKGGGETVWMHRYVLVCLVLVAVVLRVCLAFSWGIRAGINRFPREGHRYIPMYQPRQV